MAIYIFKGRKEVYDSTFFITIYTLYISVLAGNKQCLLHTKEIVRTFITNVEQHKNIYSVYLIL